MAADRPVSRRAMTARVVAGRLLLVVVIIGAWQLLASSGRISALLLPAPADVAVRLGQLLQTAEPWDNLGVTVVDVAAAFAVSATAGLLVGIGVGSSRYYSQVVEPLLVALYTIPIIVLYPVITLLFGIDHASKIAFAGLYGFFPIAANTLRGLQNVNPGYLETARALGASRAQLRRQVLVPAARDLILSGIRIGLSLNLIAVISAQMLASSSGIGYLISNNAQLLNAPDLYAYIVLTFVLASVINYVLTRGELPSGSRGRRRVRQRT